MMSNLERRESGASSNAETRNSRLQGNASDYLACTVRPDGINLSAAFLDLCGPK